MVEIMLPKASRVKEGKVWPAEKAANGKKPKRSKDFKVYRYDPMRAATRPSIPTPSIWTVAARWFWTR